MTIKTREEFMYLVRQGIEPFLAKGVEIEHSLRVEMQRELFGGNDAEGNAKFYRYILENKKMLCEECGKPIYFPSAVNVSHILTRGAHPEMAHDCRNINVLCYEHHNQWEHSTTREGMRILNKNLKTIELLKQEYNGVK